MFRIQIWVMPCNFAKHSKLSNNLCSVSIILLETASFQPQHHVLTWIVALQACCIAAGLWDFLVNSLHWTPQFSTYQVFFFHLFCWSMFSITCHEEEGGQLPLELPGVWKITLFLLSHLTGSLGSKNHFSRQVCQPEKVMQEAVNVKNNWFERLRMAI